MQMCAESENHHFSHIFFNMDISLIIALICLKICMYISLDLFGGKGVSKFSYRA